MRAVTGILALALCLPGCGSLNPPSVPVDLLTGLNGCFAGGQHPVFAGLLVPDLQYGTRIEGKGPVLWMVGYTGRRLLSGEVQVLDTAGNVVATTGREYSIAPAPNGTVPAGTPLEAIPAPNCVPHDFVDCSRGTTDPEARSYCPHKG